MLSSASFTVINGMMLLSFLSATAGCASSRKLSLQSDDAIAAPGQKTLFSAWLQRGDSLAFKDDVANAKVQFFVDHHKVGEATTDNLGRAVTYANIPAGKSNTFRAVATTPEGEHEDATGQLFRWSRQRTIIAVDVDGTISSTNYSDLFVSLTDTLSKPLKGSVDSLKALSKRYQILYISARPRFLTQKTRHWMREHDFPPGPYAHGLGFDACFHQDTTKREILADLRARWPNVLIGIGDKGEDDRAFGASGMLTLIVNPSPGPYGPHCFVLKTWDRVDNFFQTNSVELEPAKLATLIESHEMQLQGLFN
jgi:phosphatidate phosphatase APP1